MSFASKITSVARKASLVVPATVAVVTMLAPSRSAHADVLLRPTVPTLSWVAGLSAWMPPHASRFAPTLRSSIVSTPAFSAFAIGVSGVSSFRSGVRFSSSAVPREPWSMCIGPACPAQGRSTTAGVDGASATAGSIRLITDLGPVGVTALGLFANPVPTPARPVAMRVAPMFACGGGGLEMRAAWW